MTEATEGSTARDRFFGGVARLALRAPRAAVWSMIALTLASMILVVGLDMTTSRYGMISRENPYQARIFSFFDRFGTPDVPLVVISGGTPEERHAAVDRLEAELSAMPELSERVLARVGVEQLIEVLPLHVPLEQVPDEATLRPLATAVGGGVVSWLGALEARITAGLEGPAASEAEAAQGLLMLGRLAEALTTRVQGGAVDLSGMMPSQERQVLPGFDAQGYGATASGEENVVVLFTDFAGYEEDDMRPLVDAVRNFGRAIETASPGLRVAVTGLPAIAIDEVELIRRGTIVSTIAATLGIVVLLVVLLRSAAQAMLTLIPLGLGVVATLALVRLVYGGLNLVTSSFIALLLGLGIAFAVHVLGRYNESRFAGVPTLQAIIEAVRYSGPGIVTGGLTTAVAFLTTATTEFTAYAELGVMTAAGLLLVMAATFVLLPLCIVKVPAAGRPAQSWQFRRLAGWVRARPGAFTVAAILLGGASVALIPAITFNPNYFEFLPRETESARGLRAIENDPVLNPLIVNLSAPGVEEARALAARARSLPEIASVQTATDLLPPLSPERLEGLRRVVRVFGTVSRETLGALRPTSGDLVSATNRVIDALDEVRYALAQAGRPTTAAEEAKRAFVGLRDALGRGPSAEEAVARLHAEVAHLAERALKHASPIAERGGYLPTDVPTPFSYRFVSKDGRELAVYATPSGDFWNAEVAARFSDTIESIDPKAAGLGMNHHVHTKMVVEGFERAALLAAVLIFALLWIDFRSFVDAILALVPTALGWIWMLGSFVLLEISFDVANIVCLPLVLGIGIDAGVHVVHRARQAKPGTGLATLEDVVTGTGSTVTVAFLTTMVGFGGLLLAEYGPARSIGKVMLLGIGGCLVASVVVLPAILLLLRRVR